MMKFFLSIILVIFCALNLSAQSSKAIDSLLQLLDQSQDDHHKIELLTILGVEYSNKNSDSLYPVANKLLALAERLDNKCSQADAYHYLARYWSQKSEYSNASSLYNKGLDLRQKHCDKEKVAMSYFSLGNLFSKTGDFEKAYNNYYQSLNIYEEIEDLASVANVHANMGLVDVSREKYVNAKEHYLKALAFEESVVESLDLANVYNNIGGLYQTQEIVDSALVYFQKAMAVYQRIDYKPGLAHGYNNIGIIYYHQEKEDSCMLYFLKSLEMRKRIGDKTPIAQSYNNIGILYMYQGNFLNAIKYADTSLMVAREFGLKEEVSDAYFNLYEIYLQKGDYMNSVFNLKFYTDYKDSMVSDQSERLISEMEAKYKIVKKEKEIEQQKSDLKQKSESISRQVFIMIIGGIVGLLLIFLLVVGYKKNKLTIRQNLIITDQKSQVDRAFAELEVKNHEILDSINYAKRIQSAILPTRSLVKEYLKESFVIYKPKDIVAGDFYWVEHKNNKVLFAAADCTGHGVPGAMVSVICNNGLNRSVREFGLTDPGEILNKTREIIIEEFEKSEDNVKDGMDIALCSLEGEKLYYAGANNPLVIIRNGEIIETKADKQPIGQFDNAKPYTTHSFDLEIGDSIYVFSDGYIDQFGGEKGKKFKSKAFKELLLSIQDKPMDEQKTILDDAFENWRGDLEQIDDVCVIGVRV